MHRLLLSLTLLASTVVALAQEPEPPTPPVTPDPQPELRILNRNVHDWVARLKQTERAEERKMAMFCLAEFGPAAAEAVPELLAISKDELQPENQRWAAETLGAIGPAAKAALPHLLALLADNNQPASYRAAACGALAQIDRDDGRVRKAILAAMRDRSHEVRVEAIDAAVALAPVEPTVVLALSRALLTPEDAPAAATALLCIGDAGLETLIRAFDRGGETTRAAAEVLGWMGHDAARALPVLLKAFKRERDEKVQSAIVMAAARIAPKDPAVLDALVEHLLQTPERSSNDETADKEPHGAETNILLAAGPAAVPALENALRAREPRARLLAVGLLARLPASETIVHDLIARAQDKEPAVRLAAIKALDACGPAAAAAHGALVTVAQHETADATVKHAAQLAALNVARAAGSPRHKTPLESKTDAELIALLRDRAPQVRQEAAEALRTRSDETGTVANALIEALDDVDERVRVAAARSLVRFGKYSRVVLPKFTEWLETDSLVLRKAALAALAGMGADAKPALPVAVATATSQSADNDEELRKFLSIVLRAIGPDAATALDTELKSAEPSVRARAARALGSMQAVAATAIPDLIELSKSAVDTDSQAGYAALQAMGPFVYPLAAGHLVATMRGDLFADRRKWATWAAGEIKVPPEGDKFGLIDALLLALLDEDEAVCRGAHGALVRIGEPALPKLRDMLKLGAGEAPYWAVRVLARMQADPLDVIPRLIELTQPGKRPVERGTAAELMAHFAPEHPEMIPTLLRVLGDREDFVARAAISSLAPFGEQVFPALKELLKQHNPLLRRRALEAMAAIRTKLETKP